MGNDSYSVFLAFIVHVREDHDDLDSDVMIVGMDHADHEADDDVSVRELMCGYVCLFLS